MSAKIFCFGDVKLELRGCSGALDGFYRFFTDCLLKLGVLSRFWGSGGITGWS